MSEIVDYGVWLVQLESEQGLCCVRDYYGELQAGLRPYGGNFETLQVIKSKDLISPFDKKAKKIKKELNAFLTGEAKASGGKKWFMKLRFWEKKKEDARLEPDVPKEQGKPVLHLLKAPEDPADRKAAIRKMAEAMVAEARRQQPAPTEAKKLTAEEVKRQQESKNSKE